MVVVGGGAVEKEGRVSLFSDSTRFAVTTRGFDMMTRASYCATGLAVDRGLRLAGAEGLRQAGDMAVRGANGHRKTATERLAEYTRPEGECMVWAGARNAKGYGFISIGGHRVKQAHRIAFEVEKGPIPEGMCVLHRCDNPPCVKVEHLFLGTQLDNARDRDAKGRHDSSKWLDHAADGKFIAKRR